MLCRIGMGHKGIKNHNTSNSVFLFYMIGFSFSR